MIAVQSLGLVMVLKTVKIRPMAVTLPAMIVTVVTVQILTVVTVPATVVKPKQTVQKIVHQVVIALTANLTGLPMVLNAAIVPGMNMVLTVLH